MAREEISDKRSDADADADADADGLVGMIMHGHVSRAGAIGRLLTDAVIDFPPAFHGVGESLADFPEGFSGRVRGGGHPGMRVLGECDHVVADSLDVLVHGIQALVRSV